MTGTSGTVTIYRDVEQLAIRITILLFWFILILQLQAVEDLFSMHRNISRCLDTETNLASLKTKYGHRYIVTDNHCFSNTTC